MASLRHLNQAVEESVEDSARVVGVHPFFEVVAVGDGEVVPHGVVEVADGVVFQQQSRANLPVDFAYVRFAHL